ncbi:MAG: L,D-transpeptidase [Bacillota bacterium]|jgi:lipoprotein-anchoring transpeptidase ErfK/SrfK
MSSVRGVIFALLLLVGTLVLLVGLPPAFKARLAERLALPAPPEGGSGVVVVKSINRLYLFEDGRIVRRYDVATGRDRLFTPEGSFRVVRRLEEPGDARFGPRWLGLAVPSSADRRGPPGDPRAAAGMKYGLHGTDEPWTIGGYHSAGCIRLRNEDILELYGAVEVGTVVEIRP